MKHCEIVNASSMKFRLISAKYRGNIVESHLCRRNIVEMLVKFRRNVIEMSIKYR